jgi:hypothetical protein
MELTDNGIRWVYDEEANTYQPDDSVPMPAIVFMRVYPEVYARFNGAVSRIAAMIRAHKVVSYELHDDEITPASALCCCGDKIPLGEADHLEFEQHIALMFFEIEEHLKL